MNDKKNPYHETAWQKALNKQGYISCCQLIGSMKYYVKNDNVNMGEDEVK